MIVWPSSCDIFSVTRSCLESCVLWSDRLTPWEMMLLTFIAAAHPSLTHLLFALCFIERDESVFPFYCPVRPTLLPRRYILQTAAASTIDQMVDVTCRCHRGRHQSEVFISGDTDDELQWSISLWISSWRLSDDASGFKLINVHYLSNIALFSFNSFKIRRGLTQKVKLLSSLVSIPFQIFLQDLSTVNKTLQSFFMESRPESWPKRAGTLRAVLLVLNHLWRYWDIYDTILIPGIYYSLFITPIQKCNCSSFYSSLYNVSSSYFTFCCTFKENYI